MSIKVPNGTKVKLPFSIMNALVLDAIEDEVSKYALDYTTVHGIRKYVSQVHPEVDVNEGDIKETVDSMMEIGELIKEKRSYYRNPNYTAHLSSWSKKMLEKV